jgi:hypothetical protein
MTDAHTLLYGTFWSDITVVRRPRTRVGYRIMRDCNNDSPTTVPLLQKSRGTVLSCQHAWQAHVNWPIVQLGFIEKKPEIEIRACTQRSGIQISARCVAY